METDVEPWITARWRNGDRFYVAELTQDLFGAWLFKRSWGSLRTHHGRSLTRSAADYAHGLTLLRKAEKRREARGYQRED